MQSKELDERTINELAAMDRGSLRDMLHVLNGVLSYGARNNEVTALTIIDLLNRHVGRDRTCNR